MTGEQPGAGSQQPGGRSRQPGASSQQPVASSQQPGARSWELGAGSQQPGAGRVLWGGRPATGGHDASGAGYRKLVAWRKADLLASQAYKAARLLAREDRWLASQLKRAALSAPLNIVEGHGRGTIRDFLRFLESANASLTEVEYLIYFVTENRLAGFEAIGQLSSLQHEASRVLNGLMKALHKKLQVGNEWQRNLVSDGSAEYLTSDESWNHDET